MSDEMIDIVVVNYKRYDLLKRFLDTFYKHEPKTSYNMVIVDNEADFANSLDVISSFDFPPCRTLVSEENLGYGAACNWGAANSESKYIGLFNNDIEWVNDTALDQMIEFMEENPDVGVAGPFQFQTEQGHRRVTNAGIMGPGDKPSHRGWLEIDKGQYRFNEEVLMVMGSALVIRREFWDKMTNDPAYQAEWPGATGAMQPTELFYEDTALCYAAPHFGYKVMYLGEPGIEIIHQWHQTIRDDPESTKKFHRSKKHFVSLMQAWGIPHD